MTVWLYGIVTIIKVFETINYKPVHITWLSNYFSINHIVFSNKEIMFLVASVCLFVCYQHYSKNYQWIVMQFYGGVWGGKKNMWLDFGGNPDHDPALVDVCALSSTWNMMAVVGYFGGEGASLDGYLEWLVGTMLTLQIKNSGNMGVTSCFVSDLHFLSDLVTAEFTSARFYRRGNMIHLSRKPLHRPPHELTEHPERIPPGGCQ